MRRLFVVCWWRCATSQLLACLISRLSLRDRIATVAIETTMSHGRVSPVPFRRHPKISPVAFFSQQARRYPTPLYSQHLEYNKYHHESTTETPNHQNVRPRNRSQRHRSSRAQGHTVPSHISLEARVLLSLSPFSFQRSSADKHV